MTEQKLTISIEEKNTGLPFEAFANIVTQTVRLLRDIDCALAADHKPTVRWQVGKVSKNSPMEFVLEGRRTGHQESDPVGHFIRDAVRLESGQAAQVLTFSQQLRVRTIVSNLRRINGLVFRSNGTSLTATPRIATTIGESFGEHFEVGSVEGHLDLINVHGQCDVVKVWDRRWNMPVECCVSEQQLVNAVASLGHRVLIRGRILYRGKYPTKITDVFAITVLASEDKLPNPDTMEPINLFGDTEPSDYLRGVTEND